MKRRGEGRLRKSWHSQCRKARFPEYYYSKASEGFFGQLSASDWTQLACRFRCFGRISSRLTCGMGRVFIFHGKLVGKRAEVLHTFGTDTSNLEERRCVSRDAATWPKDAHFGRASAELGHGAWLAFVCCPSQEEHDMATTCSIRLRHV